MTNEVKQLRDALRAALDAMKKSIDLGCTDHLDCCNDFGQFWHDAFDSGNKLLEVAIEKAKEY